MNKIIDRRQAICGTVWLIIISVIIALWPLRLVNETVVSKSNQRIAMPSEAITQDYTVMQMFIAQYDHLQNIKVYFLNEAAGEEFNFILYDASMKILMQQFISTDEMKEMPGFCTIQLNQDTEVGREYYYLIQGVSADFYVAYEDTETSGTIYNGTLYYGNSEDTEHNIITEYDYKIPLRKGKTLMCDALLVLLGILVSFCTKKYYTRYPEKNRLLTVETVWKRIANPVVIIAALISVIAIGPLHLFSSEIETILCFEIGALIIAGIMLYGINHKRFNKSNDMGLSVLRDRWTDYLQSVFFAFAIQAGVNYMNGLYELHHTLAYREMLIYFGLAVITTYKRREIINIVNLIYILITSVIGCFYYKSHIVLAVTDEEERLVYFSIFAAVISGIVIINTLYVIFSRLFLKKKNNSDSYSNSSSNSNNDSNNSSKGSNSTTSVSHVYGIILTVFFALLIIFRNTRGWPIYLVCAFSLYYIRMAVWDKKERLTENICNGILAHFLVMMGYCLLHRPYMFFIYTRYPFIFHTVTITAVYLTLVVCAALAKLIDVYRRNQRLSYIWKELTVFGISVEYLIFTLSRTGYLAAIITAVITIPIACLGMKKKSRALTDMLIMMLVSIILCFPAVFTAQRIIPAIVAQPETMEIEELPSEIVHGRDMDSKYYISLRRFIQAFQNKVLGIPEDECLKSFDYAELRSAASLSLCSNIAGCGESMGDDMLVASTVLSGAVIPDMEDYAAKESDAEAYANGRLEIFKLYAANLNMTGHDKMEIILPDGEMIVHAHNVYLQAAHDHGIPVGIVFILFGFCTFIQSLIYDKKRKNDRRCSIFPLAVLIAFAVAGLTEWIFHPCNPIAFCLLLALAPLLIDVEKSRGGNAKK